jgi:hypothetical protein
MLSIAENEMFPQVTTIDPEDFSGEQLGVPNAGFISKDLDLAYFALFAGIDATHTDDHKSITWHNGLDEITLSLRPDPDGKLEIWLSGDPISATYEPECKYDSKLLGKEGDLLIASDFSFLIVNAEGSNPNGISLHRENPKATMPIPNINVHKINLDGKVEPITLTKRQIDDIFEEARTGVAPYFDY